MSLDEDIKSEAKTWNWDFISFVVILFVAPFIIFTGDGKEWGQVIAAIIMLILGYVILTSKDCLVYTPTYTEYESLRTAGFIGGGIVLGALTIFAKAKKSI